MHSHSLTQEHVLLLYNIYVETISKIIDYGLHNAYFDVLSVCVSNKVNN